MQAGPFYVFFGFDRDWKDTNGLESAQGHCTKSLRDSPRSGVLADRPVTN